jgi:RNA polymerase sigma-70 factor (ECF subfamily)
MPKSPQGAEAALAQNYLQGDPTALHTVDQWIDLVLKKRFPSLREDWDDLRQEIRIRIFHNLQAGSFDGRAALGTYVHRLASNVCIDLLRKAHRRRERSAVQDTMPASDPSERTGITDWIERDLLCKTLAGLTETDRILAAHMLREGSSAAELARCLGISVAAARKRVVRCRARLLMRHATTAR